MAQNTLRLSAAAPWLVLAALAAYLFSSGFFLPVEAVLILVSSACVCVCIVRHMGGRQPENIVIVAGSVVFCIAYIGQAMLFLATSRAPATSLGEAISVRSVFSLAAMSAENKDILSSLKVVLAGFVGMTIASLWISNRQNSLVMTKRDNGPIFIISNPMTIGYAALVCTIFFGMLRKVFGLESPDAPALPLGMGGMINIIGAYVGPNLSMAAFFFALHQGDERKSKRLMMIMFLLAGYNYALFTSKLSLVLPALFLLATQYLLKRRVMSTRTLLIMAGLFVLIYPFLNLYRTALSLGVGPGELIEALGKLYASQQDASELDHSVVQVALSAILGRVVGYDPLLILLQANPYPDSLLGYILNGNLDRYLTYEILNFQFSMGYSPGFLGRLFYISQSFCFVVAATGLTVLLLAYLVKRFWCGDVRLRFLVPLLLAYCLVFFSDGVRFELFRSLVISTVIIYSFLRVAAKMRVIPTSSNAKLETDIGP